MCVCVCVCVCVHMHACMCVYICVFSNLSCCTSVNDWLSVIGLEVLFFCVMNQELSVCQTSGVPCRVTLLFQMLLFTLCILSRLLVAVGPYVDRMKEQLCS